MTEPTPNTTPFGSINLPPLKKEQSVKKIIEGAFADDAITDFTTARQNVHEAIMDMRDAIASLATIADRSQEARAYEVLAKLYSTFLTANKDLLEYQEKIQRIQKANEPHNDQGKEIVNNTIVATTEDILKLLTAKK